jgi:hypothetical protein
MAKIEVTVCDIDQAEVGKDTTQYVIIRGGEEKVLDLCKDHAAPIEALLAGGVATQPIKQAPVKKTAVKKATTPVSRPRAKIMTLDEIEALKTS